MGVGSVAPFRPLGNTPSPSPKGADHLSPRRGPARWCLREVTLPTATPEVGDDPGMRPRTKAQAMEQLPSQ